MDSELIILIFGIIGTIAFSISGALIAIENKLDLLGVIILGVVTACGGGLFRDVILNREIVMFSQALFPFIAFIVAVLVFIIMCLIKNLGWENSKIYKTIYNIIDSLGLGAFVITGVLVSIKSEVTSLFPIVFFAVLTACGGGILRDIFVAKIPAIFRKHIYAVAAIIGALFYYGLFSINAPVLLNTVLTVLLVVVIRFLAYKFEWSLPKVKLNDR